jgi:hypothetical protein
MLNRVIFLVRIFLELILLSIQPWGDFDHHFPHIYPVKGLLV